MRFGALSWGPQEWGGGGMSVICRVVSGGGGARPRWRWREAAVEVAVAMAMADEPGLILG